MAWAPRERWCALGVDLPFADLALWGKWLPLLWSWALLFAGVGERLGVKAASLTEPHKRRLLEGLLSTPRRASNLQLWRKHLHIARRREAVCFCSVRLKVIGRVYDWRLLQSVAVYNWILLTGATVLWADALHSSSGLTKKVGWVLCVNASSSPTRFRLRKSF